MKNDARICVSPLSLFSLLNPPSSSSRIVMTSEEASLETESFTARLDCLIAGY